jgi:glycosyltransferase involved in cell wall biosynthesis
MLTPALSSGKNLTAEFEEYEGKTRIKLEDAENSLAEGILRMLSDTELYQKYCKSAEVRAEDFSKETYLKELISCIESL